MQIRGDSHVGKNEGKFTVFAPTFYMHRRYDRRVSLRFNKRSRSAVILLVCGLLKLSGPFGTFQQGRIRGFRATRENRHVSEVSWELGPMVPPPKLKSLQIWPTFWREWPLFVVKKINIKLQRVNVRLFTGETPQ